MMFSGIMMLCDGCDRMTSGKWLVFGTYDRINVQGSEAVHDLTFYAKIRTTYVGQLDLRLSIYNRLAGNANPRPEATLGVAMTIKHVEGAVQDSLPSYELGLNMPQARFQLSDDAKIAGENVLLPFDAVLSTNGNEIARCQFSVFFTLKPPVTTKLV